MILARKIIKIPEFLWYLPEKNYKIPEFYTIFARKMPEFYIIIARKIFFPNFRAPVSCPTPMYTKNPIILALFVGYEQAEHCQQVGSRMFMDR